MKILRIFNTDAPAHIIYNFRSNDADKCLCFSIVISQTSYNLLDTLRNGFYQKDNIEC